MSPGAVDLVIRGGRLVSSTAIMSAGIAIEGGVIVAISRDDALPDSRETIDATGKYVLPGVIDPHVHFRSPGYEYKEDWASGTAAAACGGVTTVFEMPNSDPPTSTVDALQIKQQIASRDAYVDYGVYGLLGQQNLGDLPGLARHGVIGLKCFMGNNPIGHIDDGAMLEGLEIAASLGLRVTVHAENATIIERKTGRLRASGRRDPLAHLESRPAVCAVDAVERAVAFAEAAGAQVHIAHEGCKDALPIIRAAKHRGVAVTAETCPHYLLLTAEDMHRVGPVLRVNPPVRAAGHAEPLWSGLADGVIDMLATDHAPHAIPEKTADDIWDCVSGFGGLETAIPLLLTEVNRGRITLEQYVTWSSLAPARVWGLYPRKGVLDVGSDADIVIVDLAQEATIRADRFQSKSKITPFEGFRTKGQPVCTIVRGRVVMRDGALEGRPGWGRLVTSHRAPA
ncbi:MAG: allantoinase [Candidatus Rokubacteria bacterium 13_2_20CM_2_64_8]|nr:MAG: allantoinase [Candidatus Rokubacteria bacterium 13_2_20CM_2_64_8]OLD31560.1 MAG: allantoinase [Candidatus Rokubacteria bacterium 13_1_40CM_2_68_13]PYN62594.1 MAG: allantoinase AllB [Candidatus Rokubacteria bacterium]